MPTNDLCMHCGEPESHPNHGVHCAYGSGLSDDWKTRCNAPRGKCIGHPFIVASDRHEFEADCYYADRGKCDWCVARAVMQADYRLDQQMDEAVQ